MSIVEKVDRKALEMMQYECRTIRHAWEYYFPVDFVKTGFFAMAAEIVHLRCTRCGTVRHDGYDRLAQLLTRRYGYPDGYKMEADERPTTDQLRAWMMKRNRSLRRQ